MSRLTAAVGPFDAPLVVVVEDLLAPVIDGASEPGQLGDVGVGGMLEERDQPAPRSSSVGRGVDL
jgi:hypothetical protein